MKHVQSCLSAKKESKKQFSPLWMTCEARANHSRGPVMFQPASLNVIKQFSPVWRSYEESASLFKHGKGPRKLF